MRKWMILFLFSICLHGLEFDIVVPVHKKDAKNINVVLDALEARVKGFRKIYILSKEKFSDRAEWLDEDIFPFTVEEVAAEIGGKGGVGDNVRRGWYYQQLLKFYAPFVIPGILEHVLVFDADTVPTHEMEFFTKDGKIYMDAMGYGCLIHTYYPHVRKMLPRDAIINKKLNPIAHHALLSRDILEDLFTRVEDMYGVPLWKAFANNVIDPRFASAQQFYTGASEYMIYFYFCLNYYADKIEVRKINLFDNATKLTGSFPEWADFASKHNYNR